ncbi:endoplasmic reticulum vesicle transporter-domain-containing protein [Hyaloraphidium curvatum]|nr:endoplasmic reticulum vesicle transporter-domain-containing protein [Hyaloraphidium curvatum]
MRRLRVSSLDLFRKTDTNYQQRSASGGLASLFVYLVLAWLVWSEGRDWWHTKQRYTFLVDKDISHDITVNLDITVLTKCSYLTVDVVDVHQIRLMGVDAPVLKIQEGDGAFGRDDPLALGIDQLVMDAKSDYSSPADRSGGEGSACRVAGTIKVNKVAGNLHITALGHGYGGQHVDHEAMNFSHVFRELSFGRYYPGLANPLDGVAEYAEKPFTMFQYFVSLVPTTYTDSLSGSSLKTYQYYVTDHRRSLQHDANGGIPGIFIKYDLEAVSVDVAEARSIAVDLNMADVEADGGGRAPEEVDVREAFADKEREEDVYDELPPLEYISEEDKQEREEDENPAATLWFPEADVGATAGKLLVI